MLKGPWASYWTPNCSWSAGRVNFKLNLVLQTIGGEISSGSLVQIFGLCKGCTDPNWHILNCSDSSGINIKRGIWIIASVPPEQDHNSRWGRRPGAADSVARPTLDVWQKLLKIAKISPPLVHVNHVLCFLSLQRININTAGCCAIAADFKIPVVWARPQTGLPQDYSFKELFVIRCFRWDMEPRNQPHTHHR